MYNNNDTYCIGCMYCVYGRIDARTYAALVEKECQAEIHFLGQLQKDTGKPCRGWEPNDANYCRARRDDAIGGAAVILARGGADNDLI